MAGVDWRAIYVEDLDAHGFAQWELDLIEAEYRGMLTLGSLMRFPSPWFSSPTADRKIEPKIRALIDRLDAERPAPDFVPFAPIDWSLLGRAVEFYKELGYEYVEVPWAVTREAVEITCPNPQYAAYVDGLGALVGSAEQSFLQLDVIGRLPKGRYVACSPCFRLGDNEDGLHHPTFMKVELYNTAEPHIGMIRMLSEVGRFNKLILGEDIYRITGAQPPEGGVDILLDGIEIGSFGVRETTPPGGEPIVWAYGTGLALPRFTQARDGLIQRP